MSELELALVDLGRHIDLPATPELAPGVRQRLAEGPTPRFAPGGRRALLIALAVLAVAVGAVIAVTQTRAAILEFFHLRGVTIERVGELPTVPVNDDFNKLLVGEPVTLEEAEELVSFEIVVPEALGDPDGIYYQDSPPGGMVSFVYGTLENPRVLFTQFRATVDQVIYKKVASTTRIQPVEIEGRQGYFLSGDPHDFAYYDADQQFRQELVRLAGNTLLWERGLLTLRLEADITLQEALKIARSAS